MKYVKTKVRNNARNINTTSLWNSNKLCASPYAQKLLKEQTDLSGSYIYVRMSLKEWYVKRKYNNEEQNGRGEFSTPQIERTRVVTYTKGGYMCSCKYYTQLGICCRHIFAIGVKISQRCIHVKYWNNYNFFYKRSGTPDSVDNKFDELKQINSVPLELTKGLDKYPWYSDSISEISYFTKTLNSIVPVVRNWGLNVIEKAIQMDRGELFVNPVLSQDTIGYVYENNSLIFTNNANSEDVSSIGFNDENMKNNETVVNYFLHLQTFVSDISKYFDGKDSKFRKYIDDKMNRLVRDALDYKLERFEYDSKSSDSSTNDIKSVEK